MNEKWKAAMHYWEKGRIAYNAVLVVVAVAWIVFTWPHFRGAVTLEHIMALAFLALMANFCYSAAYLAEIPLMELGAKWAKRRWGLWLAGMLFAILIENYWIADEIYPDIR